MSEHILLLTGKLAEKSLHRVMDSLIAPDFTFEIRVLGIQVAALLTGRMIERRLGDPGPAHRVILPGRCRGDLAALTRHFGTPFERGPEELKDLPTFFGRKMQVPDLSRYDLRIFAEIVDAPHISIPAILARAARYRMDGADVIDLGCLPDTPFPHLAETVAALKAEGFSVSVDSQRTEDLLTGGNAGADFLLSLTEDTLWVAQEVAATPILIPATPGDLPSLCRAVDRLLGQGRPFLADPVLDPIHFGLTESICRYFDLRRRYPEIEIMMGTGNLSELTHVDTIGIHAILLGIASELNIRALLTTEVSPHCRTVVRECDRLRRMLFAARAEGGLPRHLDDGLMALHERKPFPNTLAEVADLASTVRDPNYRIEVIAEGISLYNRDGLWIAPDPYTLYPHIAVADDVGHAFYLGLELGRAEVAWQLGKRYTQDQPLQWGAAGTPAGAVEDMSCYSPEKTSKATRDHHGRKKLGPRPAPVRPEVSPEPVEGPVEGPEKT